MVRNTDPLYHTDAKHISIDAAALTGVGESGVVLISAVTDKRLQIASYHLSTTKLLTGSFTSNTGVSAANLSGPIVFAADSRVSADWSPYGHMSTTAGEHFAILMTGIHNTGSPNDSPGRIAGHITYFEL